MRRLGIVAVGLALVMGIVVGGIVNSLFGPTTQRTSAAAATGGGCYTNWNGTDCAVGWTAVSTGEWTATVMAAESYGLGSALICAAPKEEVDAPSVMFKSDTSNGTYTHSVNHEPCAICCPTGTSAVGGFAELPAVAGTGGSGMGAATYAVLAGAAAGVLAFAVLATLSIKRRWTR